MIDLIFPIELPIPMIILLVQNTQLTEIPLSWLTVCLLFPLLLLTFSEENYRVPNLISEYPVANGVTLHPDVTAPRKQTWLS